MTYDRDAHMLPNPAEAKSKILAENLLYLLTALSRIVPDEITSAANTYYGNRSKVTEYFDYLVELISALDEDDMTKHVWDGRKTGARALAIFWENHLSKIKTDKAIAHRRDLQAKLVAHLEIAAGEFTVGLDIEDAKILFGNQTGEVNLASIRLTSGISF